MIKKIRPVSIFMIILSLGGSLSLAPLAEAVEVVTIVNPENTGDANQMRGVIKQLHIINPKYNEGKEIPYTNLDAAEKIIKNSSGSKALVFSSGGYGIKALTDLEETGSNRLFTVHLSHQILAEHDKLIRDKTNPHGVDVIVLPQHVVTASLREKIKKSLTKLVETIGVCHNLSKQEVQEEYEKHKALIPNADKYLVVILGGDSQNADGTWKRYKEEEAKKLALRIAKEAKENGQFILVLNGPRTGKHDANGKTDGKAHKGEVDKVTKGFMEVITPLISNIKLLDFQFDQPSLYKAALGAALAREGSEVWAPGESTSMVSETVDLIGNVIVYDHNAMNKTHHDHIDSEFSAGHIKRLHINNSTLLSKTTKGERAVGPASACAAKAILNIINEADVK